MRHARLLGGRTLRWLRGRSCSGLHHAGYARVRRAPAVRRAGQLPSVWGSPAAMQALSALLLAANNFSGTLPISCALLLRVRFRVG